MTGDLLIEFLTEELPTKSVTEEAVLYPFFKELVAHGITGTPKYFITPRRFALLMSNTPWFEVVKPLKKRGVAHKNSFDDNGNPNAMLLGFCKSCGVPYDQLILGDDGYYYANILPKSRTLEEILPDAIKAALNKVASLNQCMKYPLGEFIRPIHGLIILYNDQVLCKDYKFFGVCAGNTTLGHRSSGTQEIVINTASMYEDTMRQVGSVIVSHSARKSYISDQLHKMAHRLHLNLALHDDLLNEVTALTEWPQVLLGSFDASYLNVPQECLILSMAKNQKYFALLKQDGTLSNQFLFVANIESSNPDTVIHGNQKVINARLSDAEFFYNTDLERYSTQHDIYGYIDSELEKIAYHKLLGTNLDRVNRIDKILTYMATECNFNYLGSNFTKLLKFDLPSGMVGEFPELQGIMGKYYAKRLGLCADDNAKIIEEHYHPRFASDTLPSKDASLYAIVDKLETIVGMTICQNGNLSSLGSKDPFGLRRSALGVVRIIMQHNLNIDLIKLIRYTYSVCSTQLDSNATIDRSVCSVIYDFICERLESYLLDNFSVDIVQMITKSLHMRWNARCDDVPIAFFMLHINALAKNITDLKLTDILRCNKRLMGVKHNKNLHESGFSGLLGDLNEYDRIFANLLTLSVEQDLWRSVYELIVFIRSDAINDSYEQYFIDYFSKLQSVSVYLENFFDRVMVNDSNQKLQEARKDLIDLVWFCFNYWIYISN